MYHIFMQLCLDYKVLARDTELLVTLPKKVMTCRSKMLIFILFGVYITDLP